MSENSDEDAGGCSGGVVWSKASERKRERVENGVEKEMEEQAVRILKWL